MGKNESSKTENFIMGMLLGLFFGAVIVLVVFGFVGHAEPTDKYITINQETANDLCIHLTGNETAIAKDWWNYQNKPIDKGQIVCELPSYDSTHNIVVKTN